MWRFSPMVSARNILSLLSRLMLESFYPFQLIFAYCAIRINFMPFHVQSQSCQHYLLPYILSSLHLLVFVTPTMYIQIYFWPLHSVPLVCFCIGACSFAHCCFIILIQEGGSLQLCFACSILLWLFGFVIAFVFNL